MIYTCTVAPSIDYTIYLPAFEEGELNRTKEVYYYPGGKGINVSRVLQRLGVRSIALGFAGGFTGEYITDYLAKEGIITDFIDSEEISRINVKLKAEVETEVNGPGPQLNISKLAKLITKVKMLSKGDTFVLAGGLSDSIPDDFYQGLAEACHEKGIRFVVDSSGPQLKKLIELNPFLIKPNKVELAELFDVTIENEEQVIHYAKQLVAQGVPNVIVSLGGEGAIYVTEDAVYLAEAIQGEVINTVGAGDSLVAGFLAAYTEEEDEQEAFRLGLACGSATAFSPELCDKAAVEDLLPKITIKKLS